jgi:hypothetical protein
VKSPRFTARSFGWWLMAGAGLFWEESTAGWLLVAGLFWEKSTVGWCLISQANRFLIGTYHVLVGVMELDLVLSDGELEHDLLGPKIKVENDWCTASYYYQPKRKKRQVHGAWYIYTHIHTYMSVSFLQSFTTKSRTTRSLKSTWKSSQASSEWKSEIYVVRFFFLINKCMHGNRLVLFRSLTNLLPYQQGRTPTPRRSASKFFFLTRAGVTVQVFFLCGYMILCGPSRYVGWVGQRWVKTN